MQTPEGITVVATNYRMCSRCESPTLWQLSSRQLPRRGAEPAEKRCHRATCSFCTNGLGSRISDWRCPRHRVDHGRAADSSRRKPEKPFGPGRSPSSLSSLRARRLCVTFFPGRTEQLPADRSRSASGTYSSQECPHSKTSVPNFWYSWKVVPTRAQSRRCVIPPS